MEPKGERNRKVAPLRWSGSPSSIFSAPFA